jgi:subtilisin family serine protease
MRDAMGVRDLIVCWIAVVLAVVGATVRDAEGAFGTIPGAKRGAKGTLDWHPEHVPGVLLVGFLPQKSGSDRDAVSGSLGCRVVHRYTHVPVDVVRVPAGKDLESMADAYARRDQVTFVEPNYTSSVCAMPNDPLFAQLWGLHNTGQSGGTPDADIDAPHAWSITTGSPDVVVGVIDTGVDYLHEDLVANIWVNEVELHGVAGVDDDENGIVDDIYGARWTNGDGTVTSGDPMDGNGHGTHVAGVIGSVGDNNRGVAGVSWSVRIMALRFKQDDGNGSVADAISALEYAVDNGADLTNNSYRFTTYVQAFEDAITATGQLFVAASANAGVSNDVTPSYPAAFGCPNIITVAASDARDDKAVFSNWGPATVDLAAPGVDIVSSEPGNHYGTRSGSSMSTAYVSGTAALLLSLHPQATPPTVKDWILRSVDVLPQWQGLTVTGGRLNAAKALLLAEGRCFELNADFNAAPVFGTLPLTVQFKDQSAHGDLDIVSWYWDFGEGKATSTEQNPAHTYESPGEYTVSLTVSTALDTRTETKANYIHAGYGVPAGGLASLAIEIASVAVTGVTVLASRQRRGVHDIPQHRDGSPRFDRHEHENG